MFPKQEIDGFEKYWRQRKPGSSTAVHYASDVLIFFKWLNGRKPDSITVHDFDGFIEWQQSLGRASATVQWLLIALCMVFDCLINRALGQAVRFLVDKHVMVRVL